MEAGLITAVLVVIIFAIPLALIILDIASEPEATTADNATTSTSASPPSVPKTTQRPRIIFSPTLGPINKENNDSWDEGAMSCLPVSTSQEENVQRERIVSPDYISRYRCVCGENFRTPGMLQSFGGAAAVLRMSTGGCYHKKSL